jgi:hypothetical protein
VDKLDNGIAAQRSYNTATIRDLLRASFSDEEFVVFCYDNFREAYDDLAPGMPFRQKVQTLIQYCAKRDQLSDLLARVQTANPNQYARFAPKLYSAPATSDTSRRRPISLRRRCLALLVAGLAAALGGGFWAVNRNPGSMWTPPPVCQPLDLVRVNLVSLSACPSAVQERLRQAWQSDGAKVAIVTTDQLGKPTSAADTTSSFNLIVTGACIEGDDKGVTLSYALTTKRTPEELFSPLRVVMTGTVEEVAGFGQALILSITHIFSGYHIR